MIKLRRRAKLNRNRIPPLQPAFGVFQHSGGGVKPFVHAVFRPFSSLEVCHSQTARFGNPAFCINNKVLTSWISDLRSKMTIPCHAVLDALSQEHAKQYIYPRHPELDSGSIQDDFLSISINRFRVKHGMTIKGALDTVSQEQTILPLSKGEDRMLNERKRINSILGEGSSCGVASVMLNLFQHLTNMKEELPAKKIFTPKHLVSLACNLFTNKILNQVQDDITKNSHENFPFTPSEKVRSKSQQFQAWHLNTSTKGGGKSLCIQSWHLNTSVKVRCNK